MGEFKQGIMGCFSNCGLCIMSFFLPCIPFGQTAEKVGESCCLCGFCLMMPIGNIVSFLKIRGKVREQNGIEGSCCNDLLCLLFCGYCAIAQQAAEVGVMSQAESMARE